MKNFFIELIQDMKLLTNIDQGAKLGTQGVDKISDLMAEECERWEKIPDQVKKDEITNRVKDDKDFTGLSVAYIRQTLFSYWNNNLTVRQQEMSHEHRDSNQDVVNQEAEKYRKQLQEKKAADPNYSPVEEFMKNLEKIEEKERKAKTKGFYQRMGKTAVSPQYLKNNPTKKPEE